MIRNDGCNCYRKNDPHIFDWIRILGNSNVIHSRTLEQSQIAYKSLSKRRVNTKDDSEMIVILHDDSLISISIESDESWIVVGCSSFNKISKCNNYSKQRRSRFMGIIFLYIGKERSIEI